MRIAVLLVGAVLSGTLGAASPEWQLVWSDEFDYTGHPDPTRWTYEDGFVRNNEAQYYTADRLENARVEGGVLIVEARKEHYPVPPASVKPTPGFAEYTAASVITKGHAAWKHGRIEVRAKIPSGRGIWPAIWMLGTNIDQVDWPRCGEIDIMEFVGWMPDTIHGNVHNPARVDRKVDPAHAHMQATITVPQPYADFHVYAVEWEEERITVSFDGRGFLTYSNPHRGPEFWPYTDPAYLLLNVAVGGSWGGERGIDDAIFPQRMEVDYVRVYQRPAAAEAAPGSSPSPGR